MPSQLHLDGDGMIKRESKMHMISRPYSYSSIHQLTIRLKYLSSLVYSRVSF